MTTFGFFFERGVSKEQNVKLGCQSLPKAKTQKSKVSEEQDKSKMQQKKNDVQNKINQKTSLMIKAMRLNPKIYLNNVSRYNLFVSNGMYDEEHIEFV